MQDGMELIPENRMNAGNAVMRFYYIVRTLESDFNNLTKFTPLIPTGYFVAPPDALSGV